MDADYFTLQRAAPPKKWQVRVPSSSGRGRTVKFGEAGASDYTKHKDPARRQRYRDRHRRDNLRDPYSPGFWSWYVLWGDSSNINTAFNDAVQRAKKLLKTDNPSLPAGSITRRDAMRLAYRLGVTDDVDMAQFRRGMEVEFEHARTVGHDWDKIGQIVVDHLNEDPAYYTHLDEMETSVHAQKNPYKSKAQRRKFYAMEARGEVPKGTAAEWERKTRSKRLPERVGNPDVPGLAGWSVYSGGTGALPGKKAYDYESAYGKYTIEAPTNASRSYRLLFANTGSHPGVVRPGLWHDLGNYATPQQAARAARDHHEHGDARPVHTLPRPKTHSNPSHDPDDLPEGFDEFLSSYIETAIWSSTDDEGTPLEYLNYGEDDLAPSARAIMEDDAASFLVAMEDQIGDDYARAGHDFWLTRNRHGAGFWDGDWPEPAATELTDAAHAYGSQDLYIGDDGEGAGVIFASGYEDYERGDVDVARENPSSADNPQVFIGTHGAPASGRWVDLDEVSDADDLWAVIHDIAGNREWMISDYNAMPKMGDNPDLDDVIEMKDLVEEHGLEVVKAAAAATNDTEPTAHAVKEMIDEGYGVYGNVGEYAEAFYEETGSTPPLNYVDVAALGRDVKTAMSQKAYDEVMAVYPSFTQYIEDGIDEGAFSDEVLGRYIDWDAVGRDMEMVDDINVVYGSGVVYVFNKV